MKTLQPFIAILLLGLFITTSCSSDDDGGSTATNNPPEAFNLIGVTDGATNVDVLPTFSWEDAMDADGDAVSYNLYIGKDENATTLIAENLSNTSFTVSDRLHVYDDYFWRVEASDGQDTTVSTTNSFTVRGLNFPNAPVTASAQFSKRRGHSSVVFDDKMWVIGGFDGGLENDIWQSNDGETWVEVTSNAAFSERTNHTSVVFDNKIWVIGGRENNNVRTNDIWHSNDGITWTQATSNAGFSERFHHTTIVYDNKMWVIAGVDTSRLNDVWYSSDGVTWTEATSNAAFIERTEQTSVVFDDKMWIIGGNFNNNDNLNDLWHSTDGVSWTEATSNATFSEKTKHTTLVFDDKMWQIGGDNGNANTANQNNVWYSNDGVSWAEATGVMPVDERQLHTSVVFDNKMWLIGGFDLNSFSRFNDVWAYD